MSSRSRPDLVRSSYTSLSREGKDWKEKGRQVKERKGKEEKGRESQGKGRKGKGNGRFFSKHRNAGE